MKIYKKYINEETGILLATIGIFTAIIGYLLTFVISIKFGYYIALIGVVVGNLGLLLNFFSHIRKKYKQN